MADTGTLGSLLQGVSQQPPHLRSDGQVTEQVNLVSHVIRGITTRPGSRLLGTNNTVPAGLDFKDFKINGVTYQVGTNETELVILDNNGQTVPTVVSDTAREYLGNDMEVYVYDNKTVEAIYLLNRDKVVEMSEEVTEQEAEVVHDVGLVTCLGGLFSHTYSVRVETMDGTVITGSYTTPDGAEDGDAAETTSNTIASRLAASLNSATNRPAGMTAVSSNSVIKIQGVDNIRLATEDGSGGDTLVYQTNTASSTDDLATFAPHGTLVRVIGLDGTEDDFWMRFEVAEHEEVGTGFGTEGLWREWYNTSEPASFDAATMPQTISLQEDGSFIVDIAEWEQRRTGDADTNPQPGFVGKAIRDVNGFQSRLVVIAGPLLNMTVTNEPFDFFNKSAVAEVATDPLEILSTAADEFSLQYLVPFDRDLVIFGDDNQFLIQGGEGLTLNNVSMVQTTSFEMSEGSRPVSTGKTVLFPFSIGEFSGMKEFFSSNSVDANQAVTITENLTRYISGTVIDMAGSTNFDTVLVQADGGSKSLWVYKYLWNGSQKVQSSWSRWDFPYEVVNVYFDDSIIYLLCYDEVAGYIQTALDLDFPINEELGYTVALDAFDVTTVTGGSVRGYNEVRSNFPNAVILQGEGCQSPGQDVSTSSGFIRTEVSDTGFTGYIYSVPEELVPVGARVYCGLSIPQVFKPTMPFVRDRNNIVMRFARLVVSRFIIHFEDSGPMAAVMSSKYRKVDRTVSNDKVILDLNPDDVDRLGVTSGSFNVPFGEQSDISELTITSQGGQSISINEVEWVGQSRGGRRRI